MTGNNKKRSRLSPEERKADLLKAARSELEKKGYQNLTVPVIVKAAGVSQGIFYYYFRSLDDIFLKLFYATVAPPLMEASEKLDFTDVKTPEDLEEVLFGWYEVLGEQLLRHGTIIREALLVAPHKGGQAGREIAGFLEGMRLWGKNLLEKVNGRSPFREVDSEVVSHAVIGMVIGAALQASGQELDVRRWAREMARFEAFGLCKRRQAT